MHYDARIIADVARGSIISHVQSRLANAPIDRADTCSAENQRRSIGGSNIGCTGGQLPIANVAIPARSTRRHRHGHAVIEFHSRNHVRILSRGNSSALFSPYNLSGSSTLNFYRAFPPASPAREDRWRDLGLLCSRDRLSALENSTRPLFFLPRSVLLQIPGPKPHSPVVVLNYWTKRTL